MTKVNIWYRTYRKVGKGHGRLTDVTELSGTGVQVLQKSHNYRGGVRKFYRSYPTLGYRHESLAEVTELSSTGNTQEYTPCTQKPVPYKTEPWAPPSTSMTCTLLSYLIPLVAQMTRPNSSNHSSLGVIHFDSLQCWSCFVFQLLGRPRNPTNSTLPNF